jgi:uncharacterized repeat protein (TIGR01451 family)
MFKRAQWKYLAVGLLATGSLISSSAFADGSPNLLVTKTCELDTSATGGDDGEINPGDTLVCTITIKNTGSWPANGVTVTDTIDENTTYVPNSIEVIDSESPPE